MYVWTKQSKLLFLYSTLKSYTKAHVLNYFVDEVCLLIAAINIACLDAIGS